MTTFKRPEKLNCNLVNIARSPTDKYERKTNDLKFKHFKILDDALSFLKHFSTFPGITKIASKIEASRSNWPERIILTLIYRVLEFDISIDDRFMAFHYAIALQSNRQELAILHIRRCLLYLSHSCKTLALADCIRAVTLEPNQRYGYYLIASTLISCYTRKEIPPELLRIAHKMAHFGYNHQNHPEMDCFNKPEKSVWDKTFVNYFNFLKAPGPQFLRKVTDDVRKMVVACAKEFDCYLNTNSSYSNSKSTWWSMHLHRIIMNSLPPVGNIPRRFSLRKSVNEMKSYCEDLSAELSSLRFFLVRNKNEEDFEIHISSMSDHSPGDVIYEERPLLLTSTGPLIDESNEFLMLQNSVSSSKSVERSNRLSRYEMLKKWAHDNDYPEVLLIWRLLMRIKESKKWTEFGLKPIKSLLPFPYMVHPSDKFYSRFVMGYRFWYHYSAYIRLAWAWGFGREQQQYDFEWYLEQIGSILMGAIRIGPDPSLANKFNLSEYLVQASLKDVKIPGDLVVKVAIEGSPSMEAISCGTDRSSVAVGVFQVSSLIRHNCNDPNTEIKCIWQNGKPVLQVVALKSLPAGTEFFRSISACETRRNVMLLRKCHSICKCVDCKSISNERILL